MNSHTITEYTTPTGKTLFLEKAGVHYVVEKTSGLYFQARKKLNIVPKKVIFYDRLKDIQI